MYVLTKDDDVIMHLSPTLGYQSNGNYLIKNDTIAVPPVLVKVVSGDIDIPEGVGEETHIWRDGVFGENPDYSLPVTQEDAFALLDQLLAAIETKEESDA